MTPRAPSDRVADSGAPAARPRAWVVQMGEPLPSDPGTPRLMRSGQLAYALASAGYEVTLWSSRFRYYDKMMRDVPPGGSQIVGGVRIEYVSSPGYRKNISFQRLVDHALLGRNFARAISHAPRPNVIHCAFPTIEVADEAVRYGRAAGVPVIVDVRDMWPDAFVNVIPGSLRGAAQLAMTPLRRKATKALAGATALSAHTSAFLSFALDRAGRHGRQLDTWFPFAYYGDSIAAPDPEIISWLKSLDGAQPPVLRICFFGNLDSMRGDVDFAPLFSAIRALEPALRQQVQFVACGAGRMAEMLKVQSAGIAQVVFPGWIDSKRIRALLGASHIGYLPYLPTADFVNSIPNKAVEYLAGGLPVLTSLTRGVLSDLLRSSGAGYCVDASDNAGHDTLLREWLTDPRGRDVRAGQARVLFSEMFDATKVLGRMVNHVDAVRATASVSAAR